ncbi:MAG: imidazole glycerol phosphate synthase subunit HisH [Phycisphaeraceae bacterium]|nr:imidazole glycerol phosphate synthase subunit HisH [Phycisphaeraceae bacterium]
MIGIIDYRMGNLRSVQKAMQLLGAEATILRQPSEMIQVDRLVLPGVGAFADGMAQLREAGWIEPMRRFIASGRPFLGICLGMQLLFEGSQEDAPSPDEPVPGLGILHGQVVRFQGDAYGPGKLKVPHMGWNSLRFRWGEPLMAGLADNPSVYFVHSYYVTPADRNDIAAETDYGQVICSAVRRANIWATQFHPEKSQRVGMRILRNFIES